MHIRSRSLLKFTTAALILVGSFAAQAQPAYNPTAPLLIRPFGDSITYGFGFGSYTAFCPVYGPGQTWCGQPLTYGGGYRGWMTAYALYTNQVQAPIPLTFMTEGHQSGNSNLEQWNTATQVHDGYPGFRNDQLLPIAKLPSFATVTLVHSGTNDIAQCVFPNLYPWFECPTAAGASPQQTAQAIFAKLVQVVTSLLQANPKTQVFVAQIIPFGNAANKAAELNALRGPYNELIGSQLVGSLPANLRSRVTIVNMQNSLDLNADYSADGVHPNSSGYFKMSCNWIKAIQNLPVPCPGASLENLQEMFGSIPSGPPPMTFQQWMELMKDGPGAPPGQ